MLKYPPVCQKANAYPPEREDNSYLVKREAEGGYQQIRASGWRESEDQGIRSVRAAASFALGGARKHAKTCKKGKKRRKETEYRTQETEYRIQTSRAGTMEEQAESLGVHSCSLVVNLKKQSQFARRGPKRLPRPPAPRGKTGSLAMTTLCLCCCVPMSQFEKTNPISAKTSVSAFAREDYEDSSPVVGQATTLRTRVNPRNPRLNLKKQSQCQNRQNDAR